MGRGRLCKFCAANACCDSDDMRSGHGALLLVEAFLLSVLPPLTFIGRVNDFLGRMGCVAWHCYNTSQYKHDFDLLDQHLRELQWCA